MFTGPRAAERTSGCHLALTDLRLGPRRQRLHQRLQEGVCGLRVLSTVLQTAGAPCGDGEELGQCGSMLGHAVSTEGRRSRPHTAAEAAVSPRVSQQRLIPKARPSGWAGSLLSPRPPASRFQGCLQSWSSEGFGSSRNSSRPFTSTAAASEDGAPCGSSAGCPRSHGPSSLTTDRRVLSARTFPLLSFLRKTSHTAHEQRRAHGDDF